MPTDAAPERMSLVNLVSNEQLDAQYNPEELQETIGAAYAKQVVPGYSHQVKQFVHTEDFAVTFTLFWSGFPGPDRHALNMAARRFLLAACHPHSAGAGSLGKAGAPRLLLVWPELYALTCVLTKATFSYKQFRLAGAPIHFSCALVLEEIRDSFVSMEDIAQIGTA